MRNQAARRRDRRLVLAVLVSVLLGVLCVAFAVWGTQDSAMQLIPVRGASPVAGFVAGPIFIGFGILESVHRLRNGPQPPGRHERSPSTD